MIITSHDQSDPNPELLNFISQRFGISDQALNLGIRHSRLEQAPLSIVLWSFGLIDLKQYQEILDWQNRN